MARITIKTIAYANNTHWQEITRSLRSSGFKAMTNVAIDGQVSIDTDAPKTVVDGMVSSRPKSVFVAHY